MTYDLRRISYDELLDVFWGSFPLGLPPGPKRTRTALMPRGERQLAAARASKRHVRRTAGEKATEILPDAAFWPAERLHQKFNLQRAYPELFDELAESTGGVEAFLASTAAVRINAFVSGFAEDSALEEAAAELGWEVEELRRRLEVPEI